MALSIALARLLARRDEAAAATRKRNVELRTCLAALRKEPLSRNDEGAAACVCACVARERDAGRPLTFKAHVRVLGQVLRC